jgi:hypothetical protein
MMREDTITEFSKSGVDNYFGSSLEYKIKQSGTALEFIRIYSMGSSYRGIYKPVPLAMKESESNYYRQYTMETTTHFVVESKRLVPKNAESMLDLSGLPFEYASFTGPVPDFKLEEVAEFLTLSPDQQRFGGNFSASPDEKEKMLQELNRLNPGIEQWKNMNRKIVVPARELCPGQE